METVMKLLCLSMYYNKFLISKIQEQKAKFYKTNPKIGNLRRRSWFFYQILGNLRRHSIYLGLKTQYTEVTELKFRIFW